MFGNKNLIIVFLIPLFLGMLFFAIYHKWIIFAYPSYKSVVDSKIKDMRPEKKEVFLSYWHNKKWNKEKINLLWSDDKSKNIQYLVSSWLNLLDEEFIMKDQVSLQDVLLSPCLQRVYLSFDRNLLAKESSTHDKLMCIEGLLKTIRENQTGLQSIYFLVHHQIMQDYHLDFSNSWPIHGFLD